MIRKYTYFLLSLLMVVVIASAFFPLDIYAVQKGELSSITLNYPPPTGKNGYVVEAPVRYRFASCAGELHLAITMDISSASPSKYS